MSGKKLKKRRKSSLGRVRAGTEKAAAWDVLTALREPSEDSDLNSLSSSLLQLASTNVSERKVIVHGSSGGVDVIIKTLQHADDPELVHNLIATLDCLAKHRYTGKLVRHGVIPVVLSAMTLCARCSWCSDELLHLHHSLLLQLASKDRHFAIKARVSGALSVTVGLLKRSRGGHNNLHSLLGVVNIVTTNNANAVYMGKHGCLSILCKLLGGVAKKNYIILKLCADILTHLLKQKSLSSKPSALSCIGHLVSLHQHCHLTDKQYRHLPLRRALLSCLIAATGSAPGCDAFHRSNGLEVLYTTVAQLTTESEKSAKRLATLTCTVLSGALPKIPLPICSTLNPIRYPLPDHNLNTAIQSHIPTSCLTLDPSSPLQASHSAPQLIISPTKPRTRNGTPTAPPTTTLPLTHTTGSQLQLQLPDTLDCEETSENQHTTSVAEAPDSHSNSEREYPVGEVERGTHVEFDSAEALVRYEQFFPELAKQRMGISRTCSSPQLHIDSNCGEQVKCRSEEEEGGLKKVEEDTKGNEKLDVKGGEERKEEGEEEEGGDGEGREEEGGEGEEVAAKKEENKGGEGRLPSRYQHTHSSLLIIPTAPSLSESSHHDDYKVEMTRVNEGVSSLCVSDDPPLPQTEVKSVLSFTEMPSPCVYGHVSRSVPEPLYKNGPAVGRYVTLADTARYVCNDTLDRIVYDLDSLVDAHPQENEDQAPSTASCHTDAVSAGATCSTASPEAQRPPSSNEIQQIPSSVTPDSETRVNPLTTCSGAQHGVSSTACNTTRHGSHLRVYRAPNTLCPTEDLDTACNASSDIASSRTDTQCSITADPETQTAVCSGNAQSDVEGSVSCAGDGLSFESRFECGNLRRAIQVRQYEYDLILNSDINSDRHHQWFYFKVSNMVTGPLYRLNIINCEKSNSQFNYGMQPVLYSEREALEGRPGWTRAGTKITYYKNNYYCDRGEGGQAEGRRRCYYTLSFSLSFPHSDDNCYLAYHYPYSFSMLMSDLRESEARIDHSTVFYRHQTLCSTLRGNPCPIITITSQHDDNQGDKEYIVLSARVHPGESNSSWVMRGVLQYLLSVEAETLRDKYVFKLIPMLNPDGVINGSHRCSLSGQDLNRQWITPSATLHPTIYHTKAILHWLVVHHRPPTVYCDLHGHSRKKNIFMYGCKNPDSSKQEQVLPRILDDIAPAFSSKACCYAVERSKEATARVVVWRRLGIPLSYTMESTYCGTDQGPYKGRQITTGDLEEMGGCFCQALSHLQRCLAVYQEAVGRQEREDDKSQHDTQSADRESGTTDVESSDAEDDNDLNIHP